MRRILLLAALVPSLAILSCASGSRPSGASNPARGFRVLDAVVVARAFEPPGSGGTALSSNGAWYLEFEARDGEATAHYRFPVTRVQYNRFPEGSRVQLVMADERLREIRPAP